MLKNKGAQTKLLTFKFLRIIQTLFCLIYCMYIHVCTCFSKSMHLFYVFLVVNEGVNSGKVPYMCTCMKADLVVSYFLGSCQRKVLTLSRCCMRPQTCSTPSLVSTASPSRSRFTLKTWATAPTARIPGTDSNTGLDPTQHGHILTTLSLDGLDHWKLIYIHNAASW